MMTATTKTKARRTHMMMESDVPPSEPQQHNYTEAEVIDHMKSLLGVVYQETKTVIQCLPQYTPDLDLEVEELLIVYMLKMSMMLMQLPVEEDYWKEWKCGTISYPAFKQWMSHGRF
eukprot:11026997-Ditylum_brightwellii.AAC.1